MGVPVWNRDDSIYILHTRPFTMPAFAPVTTWTPAWTSSSSAFAHSCRNCPSLSHPTSTPKAPPAPVSAIIDNSVGPDINAKAKRTKETTSHTSFHRGNRSYLSESITSIHSRLGILSTWTEDKNIVTSSSNNKNTNLHHSQLPKHEHAATLDDTDVSDVVPLTKVDELSLSLKPSLSMPWDTTSGGGVHTMTLLDRRFQMIRKRQQLLSRSYEECRRITALFSKTFYTGTSLLSPLKRKAVWAIYTWCRRTDDIVDGPRVTQRSAGLRKALAEWEDRLDDIFNGKARDALDLALVDAIAHFPNVLKTPFVDMIKGMIMDVEQDRFETFDDLYLYCYRVAGTVGLMTLPIMGTSREDGCELSEKQLLTRAVEPAVALGIGLQLTNILRDVGEDRLRGRIYLPLEDLRRFNYTEQDLFNCVLDQRYVNLMKFEIGRTRGFFRQAQAGIAYLDAETRFPVQASLDMYSQILDVLEENGYDNFNRRAHISKGRKMLTLPTSYLRIKEDARWRPVLAVVEFMLGTQSRV